MTLATHAIVGAAAASLTPSQPLVGFALGFGSHFLIDAIPHWDYPIQSASIHPEKGAPLRIDRAFARDAVQIGGDALIGVALSVFLFSTPAAAPAVMAGAVGGILPDPLQFAYTRFKHEPLLSLQRFHKWIHAKRRLREEGRHVFGISSQLALVVLIVVAAKFLTA